MLPVMRVLFTGTERKRMRGQDVALLSPLFTGVQQQHLWRRCGDNKGCVSQIMRCKMNQMLIPLRVCDWAVQAAVDTEQHWSQYSMTTVVWWRKSGTHSVPVLNPQVRSWYKSHKTQFRVSFLFNRSKINQIKFKKPTKTQMKILWNNPWTKERRSCSVYNLVEGRRVPDSSPDWIKNGKVW